MFMAKALKNGNVVLLVTVRGQCPRVGSLRQRYGASYASRGRSLQQRGVGEINAIHVAGKVLDGNPIYWD